MRDIATVGLVAGSVMWTAAAGAATITIQGRNAPGPFSPFLTGATGTNSASASNFVTGPWTSQISGTAAPALPDILASSSINMSTTGATNVGQFLVTATGLTSPTGLTDLVSTFTTNRVPNTWAVTESTYLNTADTLPGMDFPMSPTIPPPAGFTLLGSTTLTTPNAIVFPPTPVDLVAPYALTEAYTITGTGMDRAESTVDISAVAPTPPEIPLPASFPLFATGLVGMGLLGWRRKRRAQADA